MRDIDMDKYMREQRMRNLAEREEPEEPEDTTAADAENRQRNWMDHKMTDKVIKRRPGGFIPGRRNK